MQPDLPGSPGEALHSETSACWAKSPVKDTSCTVAWAEQHSFILYNIKERHVCWKSTCCSGKRFAAEVFFTELLMKRKKPWFGEQEHLEQLFYAGGGSAKENDTMWLANSLMQTQSKQNKNRKHSLCLLKSYLKVYLWGSLTPAISICQSSDKFCQVLTNTPINLIKYNCA